MTRSARMATCAAVSPPGTPSLHSVHAGLLGADVGGGDPLVVAVVPLRQVIVGHGEIAESGQPAGLDRPVARAGQHQGQREARQRRAKALGLPAPLVGEGDLGVTGVLARDRPGGLAVTHEHDPRSSHLDRLLPRRVGSDQRLHPFGDGPSLSRLTYSFAARST